MKLDASKESVKGPAPFYYAVVPQDLLKDPKVSEAAVCLFAIVHIHCYTKEFRDRQTGQWKTPRVEISQTRLREVRGWSESTVKRLLAELVEAGWITIKRNTGRAASFIMLHGRKQVTGDSTGTIPQQGAQE